MEILVKLVEQDGTWGLETFPIGCHGKILHSVLVKSFSIIHNMMRELR